MLNLTFSVSSGVPLIRTGAVKTGVVKSRRFGDVTASRSEVVDSVASSISSSLPPGDGLNVSPPAAGAPGVRFSFAGAAAGSGHSV